MSSGCYIAFFNKMPYGMMEILNGKGQVQLDESPTILLTKMSRGHPFSGTEVSDGKGMLRNIVDAVHLPMKNSKRADVIATHALTWLVADSIRHSSTGNTKWSPHGAACDYRIANSYFTTPVRPMYVYAVFCEEQQVLVYRTPLHTIDSRIDLRANGEFTYLFCTGVFKENTNIDATETFVKDVPFISEHLDKVY